MTHVPTTSFRDVWNFSDAAASEQRFRTALLTPTNSVADNLSIQTQIARALGLQGKFDDAHAVLDAVDATATPADTEVHVRALLERGRVHRSSKRPLEARPPFLRAVELAQQAHMDDLAVDAMHMVALVAEDSQEALRWHEQALTLARLSSDAEARKWEASLANNLGWTYHDANDFENAMKAFQTALAARERMGGAEGIRIAKWMIARTHRSMGQHKVALTLLDAIKSEAEDGYVSEEMGENYLSLGESSQAKPYFQKAWALLQSDKSVDSDRLARLLALSQ